MKTKIPVEQAWRGVQGATNSHQAYMPKRNDGYLHLCIDYVYGG